MVKRTSTAFDYKVYQRSQNSIAQGALTNSKRPESLVKGVYPTHLTRGNGCHVWDTNGNKYIDFICGLGTNLLGYGNSEIATAVYDRAIQGASLSLGSEIEVRAAEKLKEMIPFIERVKFLKTGSDACSAAIRIARAHTGRQEVVSEGYHGWHDEFVSLSPPAAGVPPHSHIRKLDIDAPLGNVAAVILEPVMTDASQSRVDWLRHLSQVCKDRGTMLIFDEVITGFRYPKGTASRYYGIEPDLICVGKAMGNGMPISAVAGKAEIMDNAQYFVSSTFGGETCSLAAALMTMQLLQTKYSVEHLWEKGLAFLNAFNSLCPQAIKIEGYPTRGVFVGEALTKALFWQESVRAGIIFGPSWFFNFSHIPVMDQVLNTCNDILMRIKTGAVQLEGELPVSPFAQKMREARA